MYTSFLSYLCFSLILDGIAVEVAVLIAIHASYMFVIIEIVAIIHLLYWLNPLCQETTYTIMLSFAFLTKSSTPSHTLIDYMSPLIALIAHRPLRTFFCRVEGRQTKTAAILI